MRFTLRLKLILLVLSALVALGAVVVGSDLIGARQREELGKIEAQLLPKFELAPRLESAFVEITRGFEDAVEAEDPSALDALVQKKQGAFDLISSASTALDPGEAADLRWSIENYFDSASRVSRRLIAGERGPETLEQIAHMQSLQERVERIIAEATFVEREELAAGFKAAGRSTQKATRFAQAIGLGAVLIVLGLGFWTSREMLRTVAVLSQGFARFSTGRFDAPIPILSRDELGDVAREANAMARSLGELAREREHSAWIKAGQAELSERLRGNLSANEAGKHTLDFLMEHTEAIAAAVYLTSGDGVLRLSDHRAAVRRARHGEPGLPPHVEPGDGLLGRALSSGEILTIDGRDSEDFVLKSAFIEQGPRQLVLVPLSSTESSLGVVELALLHRLTSEQRLLLESVRSIIEGTFEAVRQRGAVQALLEQTQTQAEKLAQQEEELRASNQELSAQQEELRATNEELELQRQELRERNEDLNRAREHVQHQMEELGRISLYKSQFLANMSHELRTPLNSMLLLSQLLTENKSANLTPQQVEYCSTIHSAGRDLLDLINQVLDLSKIEAGRQEIERDEIAPREVAESMIRMFEPLAREKGLALQVVLAPTLPTIFHSDRLRVERIITNLVGNAIKFTEEGSVTLSVDLVGADSTVIAFSVRDTGIGIAESERERVFVPFEQLDSTSARRYQGTGLGLAIAKESAALLGGELAVESTVGQGSVFTLYLPLGDSDATVAPETSSDPEGAVAPEQVSARGRGTILVIEDDAFLAEQLVDLIRERGLEALTADRGEEGLQLARRHQPLGIVLDVKLPDIDGWTVMERLRQSPDTRSIPVHFLSAVDAPQSGLSRGAIGYLTKPVSRQQLTEVISMLAPEVAGRSQRILVIEDDAGQRQSLVGILEADGLDVDSAASAEEALASMEKDEYGCVILDLGLPEMDGIALLENVRTRPEFAATRVIVHTARSLSKAEARHLEEYAQAIVLKDGDSASRLLEEVRLFVHHLRGRRGGVDSEPRRDPEVPPIALEGVRVLVVEDDMRTVYSLSALLQSRGCEVAVAENGKEALAVLEERSPFDCVVMDIMMPEMDGYEAMRRLRADHRYESLPIIALTAKAMLGERERCLSEGASDYISKPVDGDRLLSTIRRWTGQEVRHGP